MFPTKIPLNLQIKVINFEVMLCVQNKEKKSRTWTSRETNKSFIPCPILFLEK